MSIFEVKDLSVEFDTQDGVVKAVNNLSFSLDTGETLGIVGESGSGKSQVAYSIMGLLAKNGRASGEILLDGKNILNSSNKIMNTIRANEISIIFQDPMTSLNPYLTIKKQMSEVLIRHKGMSYKDAYNESVNILDAVKMPEAKKRMEVYPHELSGGMRQRIVIAMGMLCKPKVLIADEPTTALDVTVQDQILTLMNELTKEFNTSIIMITHDLGVIANLCDKIMVMYSGSVMEYSDTDSIFYNPSHPYTELLLKSIPKLDSTDEYLYTIPGTPPNLLNLPKGCLFSPRCDRTEERCFVSPPELKTFDGYKKRSCFLDFKGKV